MTFTCNISPQVKICATVSLAKAHIEIHRISPSKDLLYSSEEQPFAADPPCRPQIQTGWLKHLMSDTYLGGGLPMTISNTMREQRPKASTVFSLEAELVTLFY